MNGHKDTARLWIGDAEFAEEVLKENTNFFVVTVAFNSPVKGHFCYNLTDPGGTEEQERELFKAADKVSELLNTHTEKMVLVHCIMGVNRSASVVLAVLTKHFGMSLEDASKRLYKLRPFVYPHRNHLRAILKYNGIDAELSSFKLPFKMFGG